MVTFLREFLAGVETGSLVQFMITTTLTVTICLLVLNEKPVPTEIKDPYLMVIGFYFGTKIQSAINSRRMANGAKTNE